MSDVICVGMDEVANKRVQSASLFLEISHSFLGTSAELYEQAGELQPRFLMVSTRGLETKEDISGEVQVLRQFFPETFILVISSKKLAAADANFVKKSGCNYVMLENEFLNTIRLEYVLLQTVKAAYVPVKVTDFRPQTTVDFSVLTILPLNKKILPVLQPGTELSAERLAKLSTVGELYVRRNQVEQYSEYLRRFEDKSAQGLTNRCRAQFHSVSFAHANLIFMLTDQAEAASYEAGKALLKKCSDLAKDLLTTLAVVPEPWNVLNQSSFGMLGATDRSIMVASMAALASFVIDVGVPEDVMMAGLFCDLGLLDLSPKAIGKVDDIEGRSQLSDEDREIFQKHPLLSLNRLLERKMQISEEIKETILCTHEQADKKGFPRQILPGKIPFGSWLIQFHEIVDLGYRMRFGKKRELYTDVRARVYAEEKAALQHFNLLFLEKIRVLLD